MENFADMLLFDDVRTLTGIDFKVGTMLPEDRALVKFFRWAHQFPKANPALEYE